MRDFSLNQSTRQRIAILISSLREETNVVTLGGHNHSEFRHLSTRENRAKIFLDLFDFLIQHVRKLSLSYAVSEIDQVFRNQSLVIGSPTRYEFSEHESDVRGGQHLDTVSIGLSNGSVTSGILVHGHSHRGGGWGYASRSGVGYINTYNHGRAVVGEECRCLPQRRSAGSGTTKLGVHLHAHI